MKNYAHLYTPVNKKASFSNQLKTHKKSTSIVGNQNEYNKIPSSKTINHTNNPLSRRANNYPRVSSRSIEEMHLDRSSEDNYDMMQRKNILLQEHRQMNQFYPPPTFAEFGNSSMPLNFQADRYSIKSNEDSELFQRSYKKIGEIKYQVHNKNIDHDLNQVLELIKQQKMRANQTVRTLKKTADHYKKICDTVNKTFADTGINTEEQLIYYKETQTRDMNTQYQYFEQKITNRESSPTFAKVSEENETTGRTKKSPQKSDSPERNQVIDGKKIQIYTKLATMLEDMNINSKQILPEDIQLNFQVKNYKNLSELQVIKVQKFFIKKLVQKIPK